MANASRLFRTLRQPAPKPAARLRLGVLALEERSTPSVSIPNSGFEWTPYGPAPITNSGAADNPGGTTAPGNLSTGGRTVQVANASEAIPTGEYGFNGRTAAGAIIPTGEYGFQGRRNVFLAATTGGGVARGVEAPVDRTQAVSATNALTVAWSFTTDSTARVSGITSETEKSLRFGSVSVAPRDPAIVYAGGGDLGYGNLVYGSARASLDSYSGRGLYKSADGGQTWQRIEGPAVPTVIGATSVGAFDRAAVSKIVFDPTDTTSNTVFVVVNASLSTNAFTQRTTPTTPAYVPGLAAYGNIGYSPQGGDEVVDGVLRQNAIYRTKDGGATWVNITSQLLLAAPVVDPGQGVPRTAIPFAPITDFSLDQKNPNTAYVAVSDPNAYTPGRAFPFNGVYRTNNALADVDQSGTAPVTYTVAFGGSGSTFVPGSALGSLRVAAAPSRPSTVYITVAQFNVPLGGPLLNAYRSTDSGINFTQITLPASSQFVDNYGAYNEAVVIDPVNADRVYLAGRSLTNNVDFIQVTTDGGLTFSPVSTPSAGAGPYRLVRTMSLDPQGRLVLATDGGVFRQTGIGLATGWESLNGLPGTRLVDPDGAGPLSAVWTGGLDAVETLSVALPPINPDQFVAGTNTDGTVRFNDPGSPGGPVRPADPLQGSPAVDLTRIGGATVYDFVTPTTVYHAGTQLPTNGNGFGGPNANDLVARSIDGGRTWQSFGTGIANPGAVLQYGTPPLVMDPSDSTRLFFGTDTLNIYESGRWGTTLKGQGIPGLPYVSGIAGPLGPLSVTAIGSGRFDDRIVYVAVQQRAAAPPGGSTNTVWGPALYRINTNFNVSPEPQWRDVSPSPDDRGSFSPALPGYTMPLGRGLTPDLPQDNLLTGVINDIAVDPFDSNVVVVTVDTPGQAGRIWRTTNGGATWADISGTIPGARPTGRADEALIPYTVVIDPNRLAGASDDDVYVGTSVGVYRLSNPETRIPDPNNPALTIANPYTWVKVGADTLTGKQSLPDVQVKDLALNTTTGLLAAATYGRGVWQFQIRPLITGFVFDDTNGNGVKDPTEGPIGGTSVIAFNETSQAEQANTLSRTATQDTLAVGFYEFRSLPGSPDAPGQYQILLGNPAGQFLTSPDRIYDASTLSATGGVVQTTTVQAGAELRGGLPGADLGSFRNASIIGTIFDDLNGDGVRQFPAEPGKPGILLELIDPGTGAVALDPRTGLPIPAITTDANGFYTFAGLVPLQTRTFDVNGQPILPFAVRDYQVRQQLPAGTAQTTGGVSFTTRPVAAPIRSGQAAVSDIGDFTLVTIQGTVFDDTNGNGTRQGEPALPGVKVSLFSAGANGAVGGGDDVLLGVRTSGPNGGYSFTALPPGRYFVQEDLTTLPAGYQPTSPSPTAVIVPQSGQGLSSPPRFGTVPANLGPFDFGNFRDAGVAGTVFEDDNGDGSRQPTESRPVVGATVQLLTGSGGLIASAVTGADGSYQFTGLQPQAAGNAPPYLTRVVQPADLFVQTSADGRVILNSGIVTKGINLGYFRRTTISGFAFEDVNGNGLQDAGEPAAVNFAVSLLDSTNPAARPVGTAVTDATGQYRFAYNPANPAGFSGGPLQLGGPGGAVVPYRVQVRLPNVIQTNAPGDVVLTSGVPTSGPTLALFRTVTFGGAVYDDTDGSGGRNPGEPGVGGVTVELVTAAGTVAIDQATGRPITTTTAADGSYQIQAPNGTFTVRLSGLAAGTIQTSTVPAPTLTSSGQVLPPIDVGTFRTFAVGGVVYDDLNGDGAKQAGEPGLANIAVRLLTPGGAITAYTAVTDAAGNYTIASVGPGTFRVTPALPGGVFFVSPPGPTSLTATSGLVVPAALTTFGLFRGATVTGNVFEDLNRNGVAEAGEPGTGGWTVQVVNNAGVVLAAGTSNAAGNYTIGAVPAGAALVQLADRAGYVKTLSPQPIGTVVVSGGTTAAPPLGGLRLGSVAGQVFNDANRNGRRDNAEGGRAGVVVELVQGANVVARQASGADGSYTFLNVAAGGYTVRLDAGSIPAGRVQTGPQSDGLTYPVTVTEGTGTPANVLAGRDFGVSGRKRYAVAADGGGGPRVQVYDAVSGALVSDQFVYEESFTGGVRVASADVNGDGVDDLVTVAGKGGGPRVRVLDGVTGATVYDYFAYEPTFRDGLFIAAADVNGDGFADLITGTDSGGGPRVTVFSGRDGTLLLDFFAFDDTFRGGVRIGAGDVDGDGRAEIITAGGIGAGAEVRVFGPDGRRVSTFSPVGADFTGGLFVSGGPTDPLTGRAAVIVGTGAGYAPLGLAFLSDGLTGQTVFQVEAFPQPTQDSPVYTSDVRVSSFDTTGDGVPEIVIGSGAGYRGQVRFLDGNNRREVSSIFPFEASFLGGLFVG